MKIKIEKNVPISKSKCLKREGKWLNLLIRMEIGDSFLLPFKNERKIKHSRQAIREASIKLNIKILSRKVEDGVRFWRIK